jgi:hypothetical protein
MKYSIVGIAALAALLVSQGCSSVTNSGDTSHDGHSSEHMHHHGHSTKDKGENSTITQAKLTTPQKILPNQSVPLVIAIQDTQGKPILKFDKFQEQLMHLIIVSDDLKIFNHLHPNYIGDGSFVIDTNFPEPNNYTIFSDYKPAGDNERVSVMNIKVPGYTPLPNELAKYSNTKNLLDTKVSLTFSQPTLKVSQEVNLKFDLKEATNNQPVKDLQPYLGEKAHLVIIKSSSPLTVSDYIHAHALKDSPQGQVNFLTSFPQPGTYKLWMQFNRKGKVYTADFWVNVK